MAMPEERKSREIEYVTDESGNRSAPYATNGLVKSLRPVESLKPKGSELRRVRVCDDRIIYDVNDESRKITMTEVARRRESHR
jgi:hypothetical protein